MMTPELLWDLASVFYADAGHDHTQAVARPQHDEDHTGDEDRLLDIADTLERRATALESGPLFEIVGLAASR